MKPTKESVKSPSIMVSAITYTGFDQSGAIETSRRQYKATDMVSGDVVRFPPF
jgi:hypothetical protein